MNSNYGFDILPLIYKYSINIIMYKTMIIKIIWKAFVTLSYGVLLLFKRSFLYVTTFLFKRNKEINFTGTKFISLKGFKLNFLKQVY